MAERLPGWVTGIHDFEARLASGLLVTSAEATHQVDPLRVRSGIRDAPGHPGHVTLSETSRNRVLVNPFQAVIQDPALPHRGAYLVTLDSSKELDFAPAETSRGRVHLIIAEVDPDAVFTVRVVEGASGTSEAPPATNPHLKLAEIRLPPAADGASPDLIDLRQFTAALGGILPVRSPTDRPVNAAFSFFIYRLDTGVLEVQQMGSGEWAPYHPPRGDAWHEVKPEITALPPPPGHFQNKWVNYARGYATAAYTKTDDGWVRLRGLVKSANVKTTIFTLPTGCRPMVRHIFAAATSGKEARVDVTRDGNVGAGDEPYPIGWVSLDGIAFATYE